LQFVLFCDFDRFFGKSELLQSQILEIEKKFVKLKGDFHFHEFFAILPKLVGTHFKYVFKIRKIWRENMDGYFKRHLLSSALGSSSSWTDHLKLFTRFS